MTQAIEIHKLSKVFEPQSGWRRWSRNKPTTAVSDVSLTVPYGEIFGLLGPNGAGKTTLTKLLCTLIRPTSGAATVAGIPLDKGHLIRRQVGLVVTDERSFYWRLTGQRNLRFFASLHGLYGAAADERIDEVLGAVEMSEHAGRWFSSYSTGMRQRLAIARALLHRPRILFLDEPSRSLDPVATRRLHSLVRQLVEESGVTIFLITHDMAEAEALCRRVAVMHLGKIQAVGPPELLRRQLESRRSYTLRLSGPPAPDLLSHSLGEVHLDSSGPETLLSFTADENEQALHRVLALLQEQGLVIRSIDSTVPSMEDVFDHFTGQEAT